MKEMTGKLIKGIIAACTLFIGITSCDKSALELKYADQDKRIDQYIEGLIKQNNLDSTAIVRNGGSNRIVVKEGTGEALQDGGTISFYYAGYIFNGNISKNNLFYTNSSQTAIEAGWAEEGASYDVKTMTLDKKSMVEGLYNGLQGVRAGEECMIVFTGKYGFGKKQNGIIPANSALAYQIWVESISNE